jgi:Na+-translocating ferredoxin:NAD+ oxidoreductase RNF subunit RnfB
MKAEFERLANPCGWPHCEPAKADAAELARLRAFSDQLRNNLSAVGAAYNDEKARAEKAEAELAKRDSEYLRGANMVAESASVWQARAEKAEAALAKAKATIEDICTGGRLTCDQCLEAMPCNCGHSPRRL